MHTQSNTDALSVIAGSAEARSSVLVSAGAAVLAQGPTARLQLQQCITLATDTSLACMVVLEGATLTATGCVIMPGWDADCFPKALAPSSPTPPVSSSSSSHATAPSDHSPAPKASKAGSRKEAKKAPKTAKEAATTKPAERVVEGVQGVAHSCGVTVNGSKASKQGPPSHLTMVSFQSFCAFYSFGAFTARCLFAQAL